MEQSNRTYGGRLITVVPDEIVVARAKAEAAAKADKAVEKKDTDWSTVAAKTAAVLLTATPYWEAMGVVITAAVEAIGKARSKGVSIREVGLSDVESLRFPVGHPEIGNVYARDPADKELFHPIGLFHQKVFEQKFSEAIRLLAKLGAREINVQHVKGWGRDFAASISSLIPAPGGAVNLDASGGSSAAQAHNLILKATLDNRHEPTLIKDAIWFPHEPTWQAVAEMRMEHGLKEFSLTVSYEDDYQVNAALETSLKSAGFKLGGEFKSHVSTVWTISGVFGEIDTRIAADALAT